MNGQPWHRLRVFLALIAPLASLLLVVAGLVLLRMQLRAAGVMCLVTAVGALIVELRFPYRSTASEGTVQFRIWTLRAVTWTAVVWLNGIAVLDVLDRSPGAGRGLGAEIAWLCSVGIGLLATWSTGLHPGWRARLVNRVHAHRRELALLLAIALFALVVRTIGLSAHPYPWSGDEVSVAREAARIVNGESTMFFHTGWSGQPYWSFVPTAVIQALLGNDIFPTRLTSVLIGTGAVVAVYLVGRTFFDGLIGTMAAAFLATLPYHVHFSRLGFQNILDSFMSSVVVWLAARAAQSDDPRFYYSAGAAAGLTLYSYPGTRLALVLAVVTLLYWSMKEPTGWRGRHLLLFAAGATISAAPQALFFALEPAQFLTRLGQEGILLNGWLSAQAAATGASVPRILFDQFSTTLLTFVALPAWGHTFNSPYPYLSLAESLLALAGMATAFAWLLTPRHFILLIWFWSVILFAGVLTMDPPASTRLLMTTPVAAILMAVGLRTILEQARSRGLLTGRMLVPAATVVVVAIASVNVQFYLVEYRRNMYFQDANGEYAMEVALMARDLGENAQIYVLGGPRVFSSFPTLRYMAAHAAPADLTADKLAGLELPAGKRSGFFATPENHALLEALRQKYPGGSGGVVHRKGRPGQILFEYYLVAR
jgi:4-amino-4-deoxy-L-arabinose transferase-like glycosyltransferase